MEVKLAPPRRMPNESVDDYLQRVEAFLVEVANAFRQVVIVGGDPRTLATEGSIVYLSQDPERRGRGAGIYIYHNGKWLKG